MICYILIKKDKYLKEIKTLSASNIKMLKKDFLAKLYNTNENNIIITDKKPELFILKELGLEIEKGFKLDNNIVKEMNIVEKVENGIIKLKKNEVLLNGDIYTLKDNEKFVDGAVIEKTYQEKYNDGLITKEEYNEEIKKEREKRYSITDDMYNKLTIRYNLKEITEQEYQEGIEEIKKEKEKIKEELQYK